MSQKSAGTLFVRHNLIRLASVLFATRILRILVYYCSCQTTSVVANLDWSSSRTFLSMYLTLNTPYTLIVGCFLDWLELGSCKSCIAHVKLS